ncbi:MAG: phosphoglycolate phosphatase [Gammaproteobacteria bacterium]
MRIPTPRLAVIDLDGTLVDSVPDLAYCVNEMMGQLGLPPRPETSVRHWVGNGVERLVRRALINNLEGEPEASLFDRAYPLFLDLYSAHTSQRSHLFPGAREGLAFIKGTGARLACVTNKAARFTEPLLRDLGVYDEFELVISGDSLPRQKPDPLPLLHAAEHFAVKPEDALLVGDSISDVKAARAAGFTVVCVSYGYNHGVDIRTADPDAVIDSIAELADLLAPTPVRAS